MSTKALETCREFLSTEYSKRLGVQFASSLSDIRLGRQPVWRIVSDADLTSETKLSAPRAAGLLLDPEIGTLAYVLSFDASRGLRRQLTRAVALCSQLSTERNYVGAPDENSDQRGAWRIAVHWLVEEHERASWITHITDVRRETAFSEEVSLDAVFISKGQVRESIERHGFPRLLLATREVLAKDRAEDVEQWFSANSLVRNAIGRFDEHFRKPEQNALAKEIVAAALRLSAVQRTAGISQRSSSGDIQNIRIKNFRNLRDFRLDLGGVAVASLVIHGPNGTGKSSLCEAISIALFRSSHRYKCFSDRSSEKDVSASDRAAEYVKNYLAPIDETGQAPTIAVNDAPPSGPQLVEPSATEEVDLEMSGTILTQESSVEFAKMSSAQLGVRVLRGYSDLANQVEEYVENRVSEVNSRRQSFLRELGLSAAITRIDTAYQRIARREIEEVAPPLPVGLVSWLEHVRGALSTEQDLHSRWRSWGDMESRENLAKDLSRMKDREGMIHLLEGWLEAFNGLIASSSELRGLLLARANVSIDTVDSLSRQVQLWGEWIEAQRALSVQPALPEDRVLTHRFNGLQAERARLTDAGRILTAHLQHLDQIEPYIRQTWSASNPNTCPTCGADHAADGGIVKAVESLRSAISTERDTKRHEYRKLQEEIDGVQKQLAELGSVTAPVSQEDRSRLSAALSWLVPSGEDFASWIGDKSQRQSLVDLLTRIAQHVPMPSPIEAQSQAVKLADAIVVRFRDAEETFEAPNNWKPVKEKLTETLAQIVGAHLPNTLVRLWTEITLNLTSAPWLLPDKPSISIRTRRGEHTSTVHVKERLARYVLNESEIHTLGLAWFLTKYFTSGRFRYSCIVMDDPAHELDQTSFRDLCRLLEKTMRLHRVYGRPLKLVIMLNQESRATDAARATGGAFGTLGWSRHQDRPMNAINVIGDGFHPPQPGALFETGT